MSTQFESIEVDDSVYTRVIDFPRVIEDIKASGPSYFDTCRMTGVGWSTLQGWRKGCEPRHSAGNSLLLVHAKHCGSTLTQQRIGEARVE